MHHNTSNKHESGFTSVTVQKNNSVDVINVRRNNFRCLDFTEKENSNYLIQKINITL